jgi:hypothetical protein
MSLPVRDYKSLSNSISPLKWTENDLCCYRIFVTYKIIDMWFIRSIQDMSREVTYNIMYRQ